MNGPPTATAWLKSPRGYGAVINGHRAQILNLSPMSIFRYRVCVAGTMLALPNQGFVKGLREGKRVAETFARALPTGRTPV